MKSESDFDGPQYMLAVKIMQRRRQFLIHSFLFHALSESVVPDEDFDRWARELIEFQQRYPDICSQLPYNELTKNLGGDLSAEAMGIKREDYPLEIVTNALHLLRQIRRSRQRFAEFARKHGYLTEANS